MSSIEEKRNEFIKKLNEIKAEHVGVENFPNSKLPTNMDDYIIEWNKKLDERLSQYRVLNKPLHSNGIEIDVTEKTEDNLLSNLTEHDPLIEWTKHMDNIMLSEIGLGNFPLPSGFHSSLYLANTKEEFTHIALEAGYDLYCLYDLPGVFHMPNFGTIINRNYYQKHFGLDSHVSISVEQQRQILSEIARERWGWGFLLEFTTLGQALGANGIWRAMIEQRFGLPITDIRFSKIASIVQRSWIISSTGWEDWVSQFILFKAHGSFNINSEKGSHIKKFFEIWPKLIMMLTNNLALFGVSFELNNLNEILNILLQDQMDVMLNSLNRIIDTVQELCVVNPKELQSLIKMPVPVYMARLIMTHLELHIGIRPMPYAMMVACHTLDTDTLKECGPEDLCSLLKEKPEANPDTRLLYLSGLDKRVIYDPHSMLDAAWNILHLRVPPYLINRFSSV